MKKSLYLGLIACAALAFSSCSKDETVALPNQDGNAIQFSTYLGRNPQQAPGVQHAPVLTTEKLTSMGLYASYTNGDDWKGENHNPNFMYDQYVKIDAGVCSYNPLKYWPTTKSPVQKISFFAYAPYQDGTLVDAISVAGDEGAPTLKYTLAEDPDAVIDFVAACRMNVPNNTPTTPVKFDLKHELTRLNLEAKLDEEAWITGNETKQTKVIITKVLIDHEKSKKFWESATYTFSGDDNTRGSWTGSTKATADRDLTDLLKKTSITAGQLGNWVGEGVVLENTTAVPVLDTGNDKYCFMIPVEGGTALGDVYIAFHYDIVTVDSKLENGHSVSHAVKKASLPATILKQGTAYKVTFTFNIDDVKVEAVVDPVWGTETEIAADDIITNEDDI